MARCEGCWEDGSTDRSCTFLLWTYITFRCIAIRCGCSTQAFPSIASALSLHASSVVRPSQSLDLPLPSVQHHLSASPSSCRHRRPHLPAAHPSPYLESITSPHNGRTDLCRCSRSPSKAGRRSFCALAMTMTTTTTSPVACAEAPTYTTSL